MDNKNITNELIKLEKKYWQAMQDHDLDSAMELTDFPCLVAGPQGAQLVDKKLFKEIFEDHKDYSMKVTFKKEPQVRMVNESLALVAYQVHSEVKFNGKVESLDAVDTSTWLKRNGKWVCAHHTETPLQKH